jgi:hypothetical protein
MAVCAVADITSTGSTPAFLRFNLLRRPSNRKVASWAAPLGPHSCAAGERMTPASSVLLQVKSNADIVVQQQQQQAAKLAAQQPMKEPTTPVGGAEADVSPTPRSSPHFSPEKASQDFLHNVAHLHQGRTMHVDQVWYCVACTACQGALLQGGCLLSKPTALVGRL